jgi:hypothetical protein
MHYFRFFNEMQHNWNAEDRFLCFPLPDRPGKSRINAHPVSDWLWFILSSVTACGGTAIDTEGVLLWVMIAGAALWAVILFR